MATDPVSTAFALLDSTLRNDATLMALLAGGIYQVAAKPGTVPDYLLISQQSGTDTNTATAVRVLTRMLFQVKVVGPVTDAANLRSAYARADALLQPSGQPLRNQGGTLACYREQTISYGELVNGVLWLHYGGLYRVEV